MKRKRFPSDPPVQIALSSESQDQSYRVTDLPTIIPGGASRQTVWRWILAGILDPNGQRVRLKSTKVGGRRVVSRRDLDEFVARLNPPTASLTNNRASANYEADAARRARECGQALDALCGSSSRRKHEPP